MAFGPEAKVPTRRVVHSPLSPKTSHAIDTSSPSRVPPNPKNPGPARKPSGVPPGPEPKG